MKDAEALVSALLAAAILETKKKTEVDKDQLRRDSEDIGNTYYHVYLGFKDAGFSDEQAFKLLLEMIRRN